MCVKKYCENTCCVVYCVVHTKTTLRNSPKFSKFYMFEGFKEQVEVLNDICAFVPKPKAQNGTKV